VDFFKFGCIIPARRRADDAYQIGEIQTVLVLCLISAVEIFLSMQCKQSNIFCMASCQQLEERSENSTAYMHYRPG